MEELQSTDEHYQAVLLHMQQMRDQYEDGIRLIAQLSLNRGKESFVLLQPNIGNGSTASKIVRVLEASPQTSFVGKEIRARLGQPNKGTFRGVIAELARKGKIRRVGRGRYQAVERL